MNVHLSDITPDKDNPARMLDEMRQALKAEIAATQAQAATFRAEVIDGTLLGDDDSTCIYSFLLTTVLPIWDDLPGELHIGSQVFSCRIVAVAGLRVSLLLASAPARFIDRATLVAQPWLALQRLLVALERRSRNLTQHPGLGAVLFGGESASGEETPDKGIDQEPHSLNEAQQNALTTALTHTVTTIAGSAHTGKTLLLGRIAAASLDAGKRVLLLAPSNGAVDSILGTLADSTAQTAYADGGMLRSGESPDPAFQRAYPMLVPERVVSRLKAELEAELAALNAEREILAGQFQALSVLQKAVALAHRAAEDRDEVRAEVDALLARQYVSATEPPEPAALQFLKERWEQVWQQAKRLTGRSMGGFRQTYREDPERQRQAAYGLEQQLAEAQRRLEDCQAAADRLDASVRQQLAQFNFTLDGIDAAAAETKEQLGALEERHKSSSDALAEVHHAARARARLVASTMNQALMEEAFEPESFDVVLVDDAHVVPLPHLYWAAGLARTRLVVTTEETALQPWHCAPEAVAGRWLGRSFVAHMAAMGAQSSPWVVNLTERFALHEPFREAVSRWLQEAAEGNRSRSLRPPRRVSGPRHSVRRRLPVRGHTVPLAEALGGQSPVVLVDTGPVKPWSEAVPLEGRVSLASALAAIALAVRLSESAPKSSIALVTPYAAQARVLVQLAVERDLAPAISVFAPPCLPRIAADIVILDTVETPGAFAWSALDDSRPDSGAYAFYAGVLNQARQRVVIVANWKHVRDTFGAPALLRRMLGEAVQAKWAAAATELLSSERAGMLPRTAAASLRSSDSKSKRSGEHAGWRLLLEDLQAAKRSITIWSPHLALATVERVLNWLPSELLQRGAVRLFTLPSGQRSGQSTQAAEARLVCEQVGAVVEERSALTTSLVIIDDRIAWDCTFPPLGAGSRGAELRRVESASVARTLSKLLAGPAGGMGSDHVAALLPFTGANADNGQAAGFSASRWER